MTTAYPIVRQLAYIRYTQGLTQRDLADRIGRSPNTVHAWETGRRHPTIPALEDWARGLGASLALELTDAVKAVPDAAFTTRITCARCGHNRRHKAKGLCASCYRIEWRKAAAS